MSCEHQWHDATTKSKPEWICARCKSKYSELKKVYPTSQRAWVGLTAEEREQVQAESYGKVPHHVALIAAVEAKLRQKNNG
jgi:protein-arginine kinase activator protein McsA